MTHGRGKYLIRFSAQNIIPYLESTMDARMFPRIPKTEAALSPTPSTQKTATLIHQSLVLEYTGQSGSS